MILLWKCIWNDFSMKCIENEFTIKCYENECNTKFIGNYFTMKMQQKLFYGKNVL